MCSSIISHSLSDLLRQTAEEMPRDFSEGRKNCQMNSLERSLTRKQCLKNSLPRRANLLLYHPSAAAHCYHSLIPAVCPPRSKAYLLNQFASLKCNHWLPPPDVKDFPEPGWSPYCFSWVWSSYTDTAQSQKDTCNA